MLPKISTIVNFGIGLFRQTEENFQTSIQMVEQRISELKELGEKEKTEKLFQIEELLKKGIRDSRKIESELQKMFNHLFFQGNTDLKTPPKSKESADIQAVKIKKSKKVKAA